MPTASNLKSAVLELRDVFAQHLPAEDVPAVLRKAVENALAEVLGDAPKRRGRPPKSAAAASESAPEPERKKGKAGRPSPGRLRQIAAMKKFWAEKKAEAAPKAPKRKRRRPVNATPEATEAAAGTT